MRPEGRIWDRMAAFECARNPQRDGNTPIARRSHGEFGETGRRRLQNRGFRSDCFEQQRKTGNALSVQEKEGSGGGGKAVAARIGEPCCPLARKLPEVFAT